MRWSELAGAPELPESFPDPLLAPPGADVAWFMLEEVLDPGEPAGEPHRDVYVHRVGNGGAPPFVLAVYVVNRSELAPLRWPTFPELWAIAEDLVLEGALLTYSAHVVGVQQPEHGWGSLVSISQVGAVAGTPAAARFALSGGELVGRRELEA